MAAMFGVRLSSLFTSRWMALLWAILVILTAIQFVGSSGDDAAETLSDQQRAVINNAF
jgi:hypothetical protein